MWCRWFHWHSDCSCLQDALAVAQDLVQRAAWPSLFTILQCHPVSLRSRLHHALGGSLNIIKECSYVPLSIQSLQGVVVGKEERLTLGDDESSAFLLRRGNRMALP